MSKKFKVGREKQITIDEEVQKATSVGFITEVKYPSWLDNMILVRKASKKWHMCVDITDLNVTYPKDLYAFPRIDHLIEGSYDYKTLSLMIFYSSYN